MYKDQFVCISIKNNIWYELDTQRCKECDQGNTLRILISKRMHDIYVKKTFDTYHYIKRLDQGDAEYEEYKKNTNRLSELCTILKKTNWKNGYQIIDSNKKLIDLRAGSLVFHQMNS